MSLLQHGVLGCALAMDAFAVSVSSSLSIKERRFVHALRIALCFALFQAVMPLLGWALGQAAAELVREVDHWLAFGLLSLVGGQMIWQTLQADDDEPAVSPLKLSLLLSLAVATSIDAFAVGVSFSLVDQAIVRPILMIGLITFVLSWLGCYLGGRIGCLACGRRRELLAGLVLLGLGGKILLEHTVF